MKWFERLKTYYVLKKHGLPDHVWLSTTQKLPLLKSLNAVQLAKVRVLSTLFIYHKTFFGAHNFEITLQMKIIVAAQACLEILELGIDSFEGWSEIVIYPRTFKVEKEVQDENGIVSIEKNVLSGEAWGQAQSFYHGKM